jgi:hypothetical protein
MLFIQNNLRQLPPNRSPNEPLIKKELASRDLNQTIRPLVDPLVFSNL